MNQLEAFRETLKIAGENGWGQVHQWCKELSYEHACDMLTRIEAGEFSPSKLGRWLGWVQAAATAAGCLNLDEAKEINKRWAD